MVACVHVCQKNVVVTLVISVVPKLMVIVANLKTLLMPSNGQRSYMSLVYNNFTAQHNFQVEVL